jgi:hypothetical protein
MLRAPCHCLRVVRGQASPVVEDSIFCQPLAIYCFGGPNHAEKSVPHFATQSRTVLSGSEKAPVAGEGGEKPAPLAARLTVSVIVRRKTPLKAEHITGEQRLTRAQRQLSFWTGVYTENSIRVDTGPNRLPQWR